MCVLQNLLFLPCFAMKTRVEACLYLSREAPVPSQTLKSRVLDTFAIVHGDALSMTK